MHDYIVTQGELGVTAGEKSILTYGASPCVILGLLDGTNCMLIHVHEGNSYASINGAVAGFKNGSQNVGGIEAHISTEPDTDNAQSQARTCTNVENALRYNEIAIIGRHNQSAAVIDKDNFTPNDDATAINLCQAAANRAALLRAMAADGGLRIGGVQLAAHAAPG